MENREIKPKLKELMDSGYADTGKKFKVVRGEHKGNEFQVYATEGDIAGLVYNHYEDKIEMVYKLVTPHKQKN